MKIRNSVICRFAQSALLLVLGMVFATSLWASDPCTSGIVGTATGCGAIITVTAVDGNGNATAFTVTIPNNGNGNPYDGTEDTFVGIVNSSTGALNSITLSSADTTFGGIFNFDHDGPCGYGGSNADCFNGAEATVDPGDYQGPNNTFTVAPGTTCGFGTCYTSGTVNFTAPIAPGGSTWFALEGQPQSLTKVTLTGQPINPGSNANLFQPFVFNNTPGQHVETDFDYTTAYNTNSDLQVVTNTVPTVSDQGITQAQYQTMVAGTSLAMTSCYTAPGEGTDSNGNALCAQKTITCTNANSSTPAGDNCPQSSARNLYWALQLDTPGAGISVSTGSAPTIAEGSDNWSPSPGSCVFEGPETGFLCPQSTLTQFALLATDPQPKGGGTGITTNSSFVLACCEVEWKTMPTIPLWSNNTTVPVSFQTFQPTPTSPTNGWVAAPNRSITWGEENLGATPDTTFPVPNDQTATNPVPCPSTWPSFGTPQPSFSTGPQTVMVPGPGVYEVHFFSTACDNQEELAFPANITTASPNNVAAFKTASFGVDQGLPTITTPVLTGGLGNNVFALNSPATASFTCNDPLVNSVASGIAGCGNKVVPSPGTASTQTASPRMAPAPSGPLSLPISNFTVPTSTVGPQKLTVYATDYAGNQSSASVAYNVGYCLVSMDNAGNVGFTNPVLNPGSGALPNINAVSANQAIPLQVTVTDCNGNPITNLSLAPAGTVVLGAANQSVCKVDNPDNSISTGAAGNSGWQNLGNGTYQYNWKPLPPKGACLSFSLNLGDGIQHTAYFSFK